MNCTIQLMENVIVKWLARLTSLNLWQTTCLGNALRKLTLPAFLRAKPRRDAVMHICIYRCICIFKFYSTSTILCNWGSLIMWINWWKWGAFNSSSDNKLQLLYRNTYPECLCSISCEQAHWFSAESSLLSPCWACLCKPACNMPWYHTTSPVHRAGAGPTSIQQCSTAPAHIGLLWIDSHGLFHFIEIFPSSFLLPQCDFCEIRQLPMVHQDLFLGLAGHVMQWKRESDPETVNSVINHAEKLHLNCHLCVPRHSLK